MKIKRLFSGVVAGVVGAALLLSGCGGEKSASNEKPYVIDWYLVTGSVPASTVEVEQKVNEYLKDKINAELKMHYFNWGAYDQKINVMIAGGDKFDIAHTSSDKFLNDAAKGAYLPMNELLDKYAPKTKEIIGEDFLKGSQINGVNYGLPANKDKGHHEGLLYRVDIAEELGLTEALNSAKSMEDIYPILDIVKEKRPDIVPLLEMGVNSEYSLIDIDPIAFPAAFRINEDGTVGDVINEVENEEYAEACKRTRENRVLGYTQKGFKDVDEKHFMEFMGLKPGKDAELSASRKYEYKQIDITTPFMTNADSIGSLMGISRTSENPEVVMQFLELFNTDPYLNNLIVYGIEGVHYEKIEENRIRPIPDSGYGNSGMQWEFGNTFINYLTEKEQADKVDKMKQYNDELLPVENLGFKFDASSLKTETGACLNIKAEFSNALVEAPDNYEELLAEYRAKLKSAGADKIVAEAQRQYDEWKKTNGNK